MKKYAKYRMQVYMKPSLKDKQCAYMNIGESIQYLAMDYIYKHIKIAEDKLIDISVLDFGKQSDDQIVLPGKFILNDIPINNLLPFPDNINPIFISSVVLKNIEFRSDILEYLKKHEPIGCRDEQARTILRGLGIEAYLMGCFTLCLPKRSKAPQNGKVFLVDTAESLEEYIPDSLKENAVRISHAVPVEITEMNNEEDEKLNEMARKLLKRYAEEADLVITSRLHAAAPCLAMGIPVIIASENIDFRYSWIDKFVPIYTRDEFDQIDWKGKTVDVEFVRNNIEGYIKAKINGDKDAIHYLQLLDEYYMDRERVDYYGYFSKRIKKACSRFENGKFKYIIWGAGLHGEYAYDLIKKHYPNANLEAVIDKYEKGIRFGKSIITGDELDNNIDIDMIFITTRPGTPDAVEKAEKIFGVEAEKHFVIITSQQIC